MRQPLLLWSCLLLETQLSVLQVAPTASGARNYSQCDSMLIGDGAAANTYPYIQVRLSMRSHVNLA